MEAVFLVRSLTYAAPIQSEASFVHVCDEVDVIIAFLNRLDVALTWLPQGFIASLVTLLALVDDHGGWKRFIRIVVGFLLPSDRAVLLLLLAVGNFAFVVVGSVLGLRSDNFTEVAICLAGAEVPFAKLDVLLFRLVDSLKPALIDTVLRCKCLQLLLLFFLAADELLHAASKAAEGSAPIQFRLDPVSGARLWDRQGCRLLSRRCHLSLGLGDIVGLRLHGVELGSGLLRDAASWDVLQTTILTESLSDKVLVCL